MCDNDLKKIKTKQSSVIKTVSSDLWKDYNVVIGCIILEIVVGTWKKIYHNNVVPVDAVYEVSVLSSRLSDTLIVIYYGLTVTENNTMRNKILKLYFDNM